MLYQSFTNLPSTAQRQRRKFASRFRRHLAQIERHAVRFPTPRMHLTGLESGYSLDIVSPRTLRINRTKKNHTTLSSVPVQPSLLLASSFILSPIHLPRVDDSAGPIESYQPLSSPLVSSRPVSLHQVSLLHSLSHLTSVRTLS